MTPRWRRGLGTLHTAGPARPPHGCAPWLALLLIKCCFGCVADVSTACSALCIPYQPGMLQALSCVATAARATANGATPTAAAVLDTPTAEQAAGLIFGPGERGAWDSACVGNPVVGAQYDCQVYLCQSMCVLVGWEQGTTEQQVVGALVGQRRRSGPVLCNTVLQPCTASSPRLLEALVFNDPA